MFSPARQYSFRVCLFLSLLAGTGLLPKLAAADPISIERLSDPSFGFSHPLIVFLKGIDSTTKVDTFELRINGRKLPDVSADRLSPTELQFDLAEIKRDEEHKPEIVRLLGDPPLTGMKNVKIELVADGVDTNSVQSDLEVFDPRMLKFCRSCICSGVDLHSDTRRKNFDFKGYVERAHYQFDPTGAI
jgi:hypothetical protein